MKWSEFKKNVKLMMEVLKKEEKGEELKQEVVYTDDAVVMAFIPKYSNVKKNFEKFVGWEKDRVAHVTDIKNAYMNAMGETGSCISVYYFKIVYEFIKHYDKVLIRTKKDYPVWFETDDFILIVAPRTD